MSDDFIPSMEQIRSHYVFDQSDLWDPERGVAFDRWLAAHDAEVRASVLAEQGEPEWEYRMDYGDKVTYSQTRSRAVRALQAGRRVWKRIPERKAGPWLPVEEPESTDGSER